jgi:predicted nucleotidyltransferase
VKAPILRPRDLGVLVSTFRRFPSVREVRVFGSRATGHARRASDIDLAISAPNASAAQWLALTEALDEAPIIYEIDVIRTDQTLNPRLIDKITREGLTIYPPEPSAPTSASQKTQENAHWYPASSGPKFPVVWEP